MLRINGATAWRLLAQAELEPGEWLIQNAGNSSVAHLVRLLAARRALKVIDVVRSGPGDTANRFVDGPDLARRVGAVVGGGELKLALDCVAGPATGRLAECLAPGGALVVFGHLSGRPCEVASTLLTARLLTLHGFSLRPAEAPDPPERLGQIQEEVAELLRPTPARLPVRDVFGLSELGAALAAATAGGGGRVLLALDR